MRLYVDELRGILGDSVRPGNSINSLSVKHPSIYDDVKTTWYAEYDFEYANDMEAVRFYLTGESVICQYGRRMKAWRFSGPLRCASNCECSKELRKKTNISVYGVDHPLKSGGCRDKLKRTNLELYGVEFGLSSPTIRGKIAETNLVKYGVKNPFGNSGVQDKIKETLDAKYGVYHSSQIPGMRDRIKATSIAKYGVDNPAKCDVFKEKTVVTNLARYGVEYTCQSELVKAKIKQTMVDRYGGSNCRLSSEVVELLSDADGIMSLYAIGGIDAICEAYGVSRNTVYVYAKKAGITFSGAISSFEKDVVSVVQNLVPSATLDCNTKRIISPYELDIYLPEYNLALECNGTYWHSELNGKGRDYHVTKTDMCKAVGIRLMHIWEHEWASDREKYMSLLRCVLGKIDRKIHARKCEIRILSSTVSNDFLDKNHRQGKCSASRRLGLFHGGELVQVMTFGKSRYGNECEYELMRLCSKLDTVVIGGASKLLAYFICEYSPKSIITYADRAVNVGNVYASLGFKWSHTTPPNYRYTIDHDVTYSRIKFQKHKLGGLLLEYDDNRTEWENMQANGYDRVWNCGNECWVMKCE